ncbi:FKBP-type peptidyl-prolyl cis-trans isomerase [Pseudarthrobacter sulfonivorans]|uniref:FKBP-type peptidyl-prolyl cis-trans isomerase n=1 Tax=Pseudarthrobacter sulfonivorans TaxID=121292 RepID=UPI00285FA2E0|nr:FKBP-type peptidyl-prolyl cis-trans isomerase [Pseudarthrobacter sulfonivorans]MDR6415963.1 peptidylprolyl isomerase [Pseudarthrobacter sulfonivorans]
MRRLLAILIPGLLLLTACGGSPAAPEPTSQSAGDTAKFDSLKLTENGDKKAPGVEFTKPLEVTEPTIKVVTEGDGDRVKANQIANISILAVNGTDGSTLEDTFAGEPEPLELNEDLKTGSAVIYNAFVGAKLGSTLALAVPGQAGAEGAAAQPTQLLLIKLLSATDVTPPLEKPEGETVTPPAGLPTVKENDQGVPEISIEGAAAPTALVAQDLIKGKGPEVKATDTVVVNYVLYSFKDKKQLESSFTGEPLTSPLSGLIKGWQEGLAGKTVGSRVLLSIPADKAYGAEKGDLVFVVDILGVR